jgi:enterochelin esterase-like enzyme
MKTTTRLFMIGISVIVTLLIASCSSKSSNGSDSSAQVSPPTGTSDNKATSSQIQKLTFQSESLDHEMRLNVYLPAGYSPSERYPVLYMIHGYGGNETSWTDGVRIGNAADRLIEQGKIVPLIIVSPELDNSYGLNSAEEYTVSAPGDPNTTYMGKYEDYVYKDVVKYVDGHYSTIAGREGRFIGGSSMGGFISLHTAFLHPDLFSKVGGHSPALFVDDWSAVGGENGLKAFLYPNDELRQSRDPLILAKSLDLSKLQVYLDCGDQDGYKFYEGSDQLYKTLQSRGVASEYHLNAGKHDNDYWSSMMDTYLIFYGGKS